MASAWAVVAAALGAAVLTSLGSLGVVGYQQRRRDKASGQDALHRAVLELLTRSLTVPLRARAMRDALAFRSGLMDGVAIVLLRVRKPLDALEIHDWQAPDIVALMTALDGVWTRGDQEAIRLADDLVLKCAVLLSESTTIVPARTRLQRARKALIGERWTPESEDAVKRAETDIATARRRLATYARASLKLDAVDLFADVESAEDQAAKEGRDRAAN
jgi:hypothetical protein